MASTPRQDASTPAATPPSSPTPDSPTLSIPVRVELADPDAPRAAPSAAPRRIGRYAIHAEIGRGGMGVVYRAFDRDLRRDVALKVLHPDLPASPRLVERFVEEAQAMAQLQHPAIVPIYEIGRDDAGGLFLVMKLVSGRTLAQAAKGRLHAPETPGVREFTFYRLLRVCIDAARAVAFAHERGVIHRDLKPQNIMVGRHGEVHILDWGLAKALAAEAPREGAGAGAPAAASRPAHPHETPAGAVIGTPAYMAPEQATDGGRADARSDVYALGATLYQVLTGRAPFEGQSSDEVIAKVLGTEPAPPRSLERTLPPPVEAICLRALAKDPAARYPSAAAFADDLEAFLAGEAVRAHRAGPLERAARWLRRHRVAVGVLLAAGLVAAVTAAAVRSARDRAARDERAAVARRARDDARDAWEALERARAAPADAGAGPEALRGRRDALLGLGYRALEAADHAARVETRADAAPDLVLRSALALAGIASDAEQWSLAASVLDRAAALGIEPGRVREARGALERARTRLAEEHRRIVLERLAEARDGKTGLAGAHEDALFAITAFREAQTVSLVADALDAVTAALRAAEREALLAVAEPTPEEARAGASPITAVAAALDAAAATATALPADLRRPIDEAWRRLEARARRSLPESAPQAPPDARTILARVQEERAGRGPLALARLCCDALGRIGIREGAVEPLGRYLLAERDESRAVPAGAAVCLLGGERADALILAAFSRARLGGALQLALGPILERTSVGTRVVAQTAQAYVERAILRGRSMDMEGALADLDRAVALDPRSAAAYETRGYVKRFKKDLEGALADCDRAVEIDPQRASAWAYRGLVRRSRRELDVAEADLTRAVTLDGRVPSHWQNRGTVRMDRRDFAGAVADFTRALEIDPRYAVAWNARGVAHVRLGDLDAALADFGGAIGADPSYAAPYTCRANIHGDRGDLDAAFADHTRAIELQPNDPAGWLNRGIIRRRRGDFKGAIADYDEAAARGDGSSAPPMNRAIARARLGDLAGAIADATRAIELEPEIASCHVVRGEARAESGDLAGALADLDRAAALAPRSASVRTTRGAVRSRAGDAAGAIADFTEAIRLDPGDPDAYVDRGNLRFERGDYAGAIADGARAIELAPRSEAGWSLRGRARAECGQADGALADLGRAIDIARAPEALLARGFLRLDQGEHQGAIADAEATLAVDPAAPRAFLLRGLARAKGGDREGARADLRRTIELAPEGPQAGFARERLREIEAR